MEEGEKDQRKEMSTINCIGLGMMIAGLAMIHPSLGFIAFGFILLINNHKP